jgi:hypothetical protein
MRVEFPQGVPEGCTEWLNKHVGKGNITNIEDSGDYAWFYKRERVYPQGHEAFDPNFPWRYVPTITVKDPKLATWFMLRWS